MFYVAFFGVFKIAGMWGRMYIKKEKANHHLIIGFFRAFSCSSPYRTTGCNLQEEKLFFVFLNWSTIECCNRSKFFLKWIDLNLHKFLVRSLNKIEVSTVKTSNFFFFMST